MPEHDRPDPSTIVSGPRNRGPSERALAAASTAKRNAPASSDIGDENSGGIDGDTPHARKRARTSQEDEENAPGSSNSASDSSREPAGVSNRTPIIVRDENDLDADGLLKDLANIGPPVVELSSEKKDVTRDLKHFFEDAGVSVGAKGKSGKRRKCKTCTKILSADVSTCRRHMASQHKGRYRAWCKETEFPSMLDEDVQARKSEAAAKQSQSLITTHTTVIDKSPQPKKYFYSDDNFLKVSLKWLVVTDQPLSAFQRPEYVDMIRVAAMAPNGVVKIPSGKVTRRELLLLFHDVLFCLREKFTKSDTIKGSVSFTTDAWSALNKKSFFTVSAHWVEETAKLQWKLKSCLIGFPQLVESHTAVRMGQGLFKVVKRVGLVKRAGHITADNIAGNCPMIGEFFRLVQLDPDANLPFDFDALHRYLRCLAHVVNIGAQTFLKVLSQAKYYDPKQPEAHLPASGEQRDELGIIRVISVKESSSSVRHAKFIQIQEAAAAAAAADAAAKATSTRARELFEAVEPLLNAVTDAAGKPRIPRHLIVDMCVRWSSTYNMVLRAWDLKDAVDDFVLYMIRKETNTEKKAKLELLRLTSEEWAHIGKLAKILQLFDDAQQEFSSSSYPTLHLAVPALETLHKKLSAFRARDHYARFHPALDAATQKLAHYYDRTGDTDAFIMSMVLNPTEKFGWISREWDAGLYASAERLVREKFKSRHADLHGPTGHIMQASSIKKSRKMERLLSTSDTEDNITNESPASIETWESEYRNYINLEQSLEGEDNDLVTHWGLVSHRLPTWASLAADYLPIMGSGVFSEASFSSAGITVTKRRNRLKGDVTEALQVMKSVYRQVGATFEKFPCLRMEEEIENAATAEEKVMESLPDIFDDMELASDCEED